MGTPLAKLKRLHASVVAKLAGTIHAAPLAAYLEKVGHRPTEITDAEVAALLASGHDQDAIFEATVGEALGAAIIRLEAGLAALEGTKDVKP